jgi:hypothetical protein
MIYVRARKCKTVYWDGATGYKAEGEEKDLTRKERTTEDTGKVY